MISINILVFCNILITSTILFFKKKNVLPNKILAIIFLIPGLNFANNINILNGTIYSFPYPYFIVQGTALLFAPLVYYYILLLIGKKTIKHKTLLFFTLLLVLFDIYLGVEFTIQDQNTKHEYINSLLNGPYPIKMELLGLFTFLHQLIYFSMGIKEINRYHKNTKDVLSDIEVTKYAYLKRFILLLWILTALTILLYATIDTLYVEYVYLPLIILIVYFFILYYAFHHNAIFTHETFNVQLDFKNTQIQSLVNTIPEEKRLYPEELPEKILLHMSEKKIFKDPELSVYKLAIELNYPVHQISKAINQGLSTSFYDLINKKRVDESMKLLNEKDKNNFTIEGVAYEVGFNSRAAFYRAFKKYTGKNPSEYKE